MGQVKDIAHTPGQKLKAPDLYKLQDWATREEGKLIHVIEQAQRQEPPNERVIGVCGALALAEMGERGSTEELEQVARMAFPGAYGEAQ